MKENNDRVSREIAPINSSQLHIPQENALVSVLKVFNPLGSIAEAYARTLTYKIESKRIEAEINRVNKQSEVIKHTIDKQFELKMEELKERKFALEEFFKTVREQLTFLHIERMKVLEMADIATKKSLEPNLPFEERQLFVEMSKEIIKQIPNFGDKANESLKIIVNSLPSVEISGYIG